MLVAVGECAVEHLRDRVDRLPFHSGPAGAEALIGLVEQTVSSHPSCLLPGGSRTAIDGLTIWQRVTMHPEHAHASDSSNGPPRQRRERSRPWKYFKCKFCNCIQASAEFSRETFHASIQDNSPGHAAEVAPGRSSESIDGL